MVMAMSRPQFRKGSKFPRFRRRVPADLVAIVGRREVVVSLRTMDVNEAKRLAAEKFTELEAEWAQLRRDRVTESPDGHIPFDSVASTYRSLSEREADERAQWMYAHWLSLHRENPSQQRFWPTDLYRHLWRSPDGRLEPRKDGSVAVRSVLGFAQAEKVAELEAWCRNQAETVLVVNDIEADDASTLRVAKAVAAQVQRASLTLEALSRGEPDEPVAASMPAQAATPAASPMKAIGLIELVEAWWREAERTGKSESTRESYTNTIKQLIAFLGHDDAHRVTADDVRRFKDHRLTTPRANGRLLSPTTVKNSDLAALKSVFGWGVVNGRLLENPATNVTVARVSKVKLREREFTSEEARQLLRAASTLTRGKELPQTFAAKQWIPWVLAFTGARVGEIAQLRRQDLTRVDLEGHSEGVWVLRIPGRSGRSVACCRIARRTHQWGPNTRPNRRAPSARAASDQVGSKAS